MVRVGATVQECKTTVKLENKERKITKLPANAEEEYKNVVVHLECTLKIPRNEWKFNEEQPVFSSAGETCQEAHLGREKLVT